MFRVAARLAFPMRPVALLRPRNLRTSLVRFQSSSANHQPKGLRALMKEYGYSALGVYLFLSALDLPVCYALVHMAGKEKIEEYENKAKQFFGYGKSDEELARMQEINRIEEEHNENASAQDSSSMFSWFSWTELAIAYGIHKSVFIFVRVPLTAALTPSIVKTLRGWGFKIGSDKLATTAAIAKDNIASASSAKFGTRPNKKNKWFWFF